MKHELHYPHADTEIKLGILAVIGSIILCVIDLFTHNTLAGALVSAYAAIIMFYEAYTQQVRHTEFIIDQYEGKGVSKYL